MQDPPVQNVSGGQTCPQVPQLLLSVFWLLSHPFVGLLSQSWKPELQKNPQFPPVQVRVPFVRFGHTTPQLEQLFTSVLMFVSHPFETVASQSRKPVLQLAIVQFPLVQAGVPFATLQMWPQLPQL